MLSRVLRASCQRGLATRLLWQPSVAARQAVAAASSSHEQLWASKAWVHSSAASWQTEAQPRQEGAVGDKLAESTYHHMADFTLGDLWNRCERALRTAEGEEFDYDVKAEHGTLKISFPSGAWVTISKAPGERGLRVQNTLYPAYENREEVIFKMGEGGRTWEWEEEEEDLYMFLEGGLSKHLKVNVTLRDKGQKGEDGG